MVLIYKQTKVLLSGPWSICVDTNSQDSIQLSAKQAYYIIFSMICQCMPPTGLEPATNCLADSSLSF